MGKEYKYLRNYSEVKRLLSLPLKAPGKQIVLSRLTEGESKIIYDLRVFSNGERTPIGLLMTEYNLLGLMKFLNENFAEKVNNQKSEVERLLGYDPWEKG